MDSVTIAAGPVSVKLLKGCRVAARPQAGQLFEPESLAAWARIVSPGQMALDVGAYTGLYAIAARKLGALVMAFEPLTAQYERMIANVFLNEVRLVTRQVAISNENGNAFMNFNGSVPLTSGASLDHRQISHNTRELVRTVRLSSIEFPCRVAAIKIDVEGAELKVLQGAAELIDRDRPSLIIEALNDEAVSNVARILPGYRLEALLDRRNMLLVPA
jgi:FkbM family methyltransferase